MYTDEVKPLQNHDASEDRQPAAKPDPECILHVRDGGVTACLQVKAIAEDQQLDAGQIFALLQAQGVSYGICQKEIEDYCRRGQYTEELVCAKGLLSIDGIDGKIQYHFERNNDIKPQEREDGSVDYFDLGLIQNVKKGDTLCSLTLPQPGIDGMDVYGKTIGYKKGLRPDFPQGRNTEVTSDGMQLIASIDGYIDYGNLMVNVIDVYTIKGDVDHSIGNIDFVGTVMVNGDVREGFCVKAGRDVVVRGMVEGCTIEAQNDITIMQGMKGMGKGKLIAGGNVKGRFFENSGISAKKNVIGETFMNCNVKAGRSIIANGRRGSLIGGDYTAEAAIYTKQIGSESYSATNVTIKLPQHVSNQLAPENAEVKESLQEENKDRLAKVEQAISQIKASQYDAVTKVQYLKALIGEKLKLQTALKELDEAPPKKESALTIYEHKIVAVLVVYPGVKIAIGPCRLYVGQEYCNQKFYIDSGEIRPNHVSPADRSEFLND